MSGQTRVCSSCGAVTDPVARFCSQCGHLLGTEPPHAYQQPPPRLYGVLPADGLLGAACLFLASATVALVAGAWILGLVLLVPALWLLILFSGVATKSTVARAAVSVGRRLRGWLGFAARALGAWVGAGAEVLQLRFESRALRRERERVQRALGDAALREDDEAVGAMRSLIGEIDDGIAERERARVAALRRARREIAGRHAAVRRTERRSVRH
jgi:zinc ribbon protein